MEEILESIKRIIADEETPQDPGDDILELTEIVEEEPAAEAGAAADILDDIDASLEASPETEPAPAAEAETAPEAETPATASADDIDALFADAAPAATAPEPAPAAEPETIAAAAEPEQAAPATPVPTAERLIDDVTEQAARSALGKLRQAEQPQAPAAPIASPAFRNGDTVEDLVLETLRPMVKEWLDRNLPEIVERLVEREIKRLAR